MNLGIADACAFAECLASGQLDAYGRDLTDFSQWLGSDPVDRAKIERYLADLAGRGLAASTRARKLSALKQFYRFSFTEGWREDDPAAGLAGPALGRRLPDALTEEEAGRLLSAAEAAPGAAMGKVRLHCLMELLYATGLRATELVGLPVAAVRGDPRMIMVRGKGGRERMVPLSEPAREALMAWLAIRDQAEEEQVASGGRASPHLFPSRGKAGHLHGQTRANSIAIAIFM